MTTTTNYLPAVATSKTAIENLREAAQGVGSGGGTGDTYLKVDDRTGALTYGKERTPFPKNHPCVVALFSFMHGYIEMQGSKMVERKLTPMMHQPVRPVPARGYATKFGQDGAKDVTEITLTSVKEKGATWVFTAWSKSSANRVRNLLEQAVVHEESPEGQAGFIHPVIVPKSNHYQLKQFTDPDTGEVIPARPVHHFDFDVVDWLHTDGETFASSRGGELVDATQKEFWERDAEERAPWDDDEELTDAEREVFAGRS